MIRAVLDTNVVVSAAIKSGGKPDQIIRQAATVFEWLTSEYILAEIANVLTRSHIQQKYRAQVSKSNRARFLASVRAAAEVVRVKTEVEVLMDDPKDNAILACGKDGGANYIVTGDRYLLGLGIYEGIKIVTPDQFLQILQTEQSAGSPSTES